MIHVYTGDGKGKTTAAFGLAMRACGQGMKVIIFQFLKPAGLSCGEQVSVRKVKGVRLVKFKESHPMFKALQPSSADLKKAIKKDFNSVKRAVKNKKYGMIVLDEIINVMDQDFIPREELLSFLKSIEKDTELVLTGRGDISSIEEYADYITVMLDKKHPYKRGVEARQGIEY